MIDELRRTITFLRQNGIIHFDLYFDNIMTDGTKPYLADFGLLLDKRFALNDAERLFFRNHTYYDYGMVVCELGWLLYGIYQQLTAKQKERINAQYGLTTEMSHLQHWQILFENIEALYADGLMKLDQHYVETVLNYEPVIHFMQTFFSSLRGNPKKDTRFSDAKLRTLLKKTGFLPGQAG
jgi:serine/threonine protein kinase